MNQNTRKGFTLIELLVVIAVIGILSSVVFASLNSARAKGADAGVKKSLEAARSQGELYFYANGNSYGNVCGTNSVGGVKPIGVQIQNAAAAENISSINTDINTAGTNSTVTCHASATAPSAWAAEVPLKTTPPANPMFCVDSTGVATTTTGSTLSAGKTSCG